MTAYALTADEAAEIAAAFTTDTDLFRLRVEVDRGYEYFAVMVTEDTPEGPWTRTYATWAEWQEQRDEWYRAELESIDARLLRYAIG